ncbi:uncharacterized protein LOC113325111 [Papaver somniferum]|uniref:uncharacterized protein LOC113325111 n=1 Tax=Papaver somniferum TaxID=3469 RepID=UPI000E703981|nr:uncharacterized protein LOC113325111 [Papaver somniferum]
MEILSNENNVRKITSIELPDDLYEKSLDPWKFSLKGRLDLQKTEFFDVVVILRSQWKLQGDCCMIPLGRGFFTIKLDNENDKKLIKSQRWEVSNQILQVRNWVSNFRPASQRISKAMVWVRFPGLGLEFWDEAILFKICNEFGTPIKVDNATARCEVGYYANVLVEVDFALHIPNKIWIGTKYGGFFQDVVIPDCPKYFSSCKIVGHLNAECRYGKNKNVNAQQEQVKFQTISKEGRSLSKETSEPFDICDVSSKEDSIVDSIQQTTLPNILSVAIFQHSKFSPLENVESVVIPADIIKEVSSPKVTSSLNVGYTSNEASSTIVEATPTVVLSPNVATQTPQETIRVMEVNSNMIPFVDGTNGTVVNTPVQVTSWAEVVEK